LSNPFFCKNYYTTFTELKLWAASVLNNNNLKCGENSPSLVTLTREGFFFKKKLCYESGKARPKIARLSNTYVKSVVSLIERTSLGQAVLELTAMYASTQFFKNRPMGVSNVGCIYRLAAEIQGAQIWRIFVN
jgi:hypothetical protein